MIFFLIFLSVEIFTIYPKSHEQRQTNVTRGKSLLDWWGTTFLRDWQLPLIFVWFTSKSYEQYPYY